jgi:hypothetical protein
MQLAGSICAARKLHKSLPQAQGRLFAAKTAAQDDNGNFVGAVR